MNPSQLPQAGIADAGKDALLSFSQRRDGISGPRLRKSSHRHSVFL